MWQPETPEIEPMPLGMSGRMLLACQCYNAEHHVDNDQVTR